MNISKMTLTDIEALATRLEKAARVIRESQSLLGVGPVPTPAVGGAALLPASPPPPQIAADPQLAADRMRLMQQFKKGDLPPELEAAAGIS